MSDEDWGSLDVPSQEEQEESARARTVAVYQGLRKRYQPPEWVVFREVPAPPGRGPEEGRQADFIALNTYRSRGFEIHGVEVKASRSDWLSELDDGAKNEWFLNRCDKWWVAAPTGIIEPKELPRGWGLLQLRSDNVLYSVEKPDPRDPVLDREWLAALLKKRRGDNLPATEEEFRAAKQNAYQRGKEQGQKEVKRQQRFQDRRAERAKEVIRALDEHCDVHVTPYRAEEVGEALNVLFEAKRAEDGLDSRLDGIINKFRQRLDDLETVYDDWQEETDDEAS